jgi:hypothetical protein
VNFLREFLHEYCSSRLREYLRGFLFMHEFLKNVCLVHAE